MNKRKFLGMALALAVFLGIVGWIVTGGIQQRVSANQKLKQTTEQAAIWSVFIVKPELGGQMEEISLPGNVQAFSETPIYARTGGYLKAWFFDIGANVQQGQLLAEIEAPEVDKQLQQAKAELATAQASLDLARSTAERWKTLLKTNSVSQQETDEKLANANVQNTNREASASNVKRLEDLKSFQKIYAPFAGVITARKTDIGALINAGGSAGGQELFHLSAIHKLRVFVNVPQIYSSASRQGARAEITLQESPEKKHYGRLVRTANVIDPAARTLLTEFEVDNASGSLLPGSYVTVNMKLPGKARSYTLPSTALLFRSEGLRVAVVKDGTVTLRPIVLGRDFGTTVEVVSGVGPDDSIVADPPDSLANGAKVRLSRKAEGD